MRAIPILLLLVLTLLSACTSEGERVYAEAKKCATEITEGKGCSSPQSQNGDRQQQQPQQTSPQPSPVEKPQSATGEESRVYLDATQSMKGFASPQNNTFTKLIESLSYAMPGCRLYKYGMKGEKATAQGDASDFASEIKFSQDLRNPSFYDLDYNEDDSLFNHLAQEDRPVRSVLITDGVYSARQSELQSEVVKAIERWMKRGRFFGILIFNSPFEGKLYSENKRIWIEQVNVQSRPFYAFVFSPDEKSFRDLRERLLTEFSDIQSLTFPSQAIFCQLKPEEKTGLVFEDIWPTSPFYLQMYDESIFDDKNLTELAYELRCLPAADYPVAELGLNIGLDYYIWQQEQGGFKKEERPPQFDYQYPAKTQTGVPAASSPSPGASASATATPSPAPNATELPKLKLTLRKDSRASYGLYHLVLDLSNKALKPDVRARSTEDDSQPKDADKTYRFYEFISALTTIHLQNKETVKMPPPVFVALTNK